MNYLVVLFKNKQRKKILKKFKTKQKANAYFNRLIGTEVIFDKRVENGLSCVFEVGILEKNSNDFELYFVRDSLGRQIKVDIDDPDYKLIQILKYSVEEFIYDINNKTKISFTNLVKKYLPKTGIKLISKLNHKIVIQNEDTINLNIRKQNNTKINTINNEDTINFNIKKHNNTTINNYENKTNHNITHEETVFNAITKPNHNSFKSYNFEDTVNLNNKSVVNNNIKFYIFLLNI